MRPGLVPVMKTDKNGVNSVRWMREDSPSATSRDLPKPTSGSFDTREQAFRAVLKHFERFGREDDYIQEWEDMGTAELAIVDRLLSRPEADIMLLDAIENRVWTAASVYRPRWLALMERHCDALSGYSYRDIADVLSATLRFSGRLSSRTISLNVNPTQEYNYARLNLAAINSKLAEATGKTRYDPSDYGVEHYVDIREIDDFAFECESPERLERACAAIENGAESFSAVVAVADGDVAVALVDGAL